MGCYAMVGSTFLKKHKKCSDVVKVISTKEKTLNHVRISLI